MDGGLDPTSIVRVVALLVAAGAVIAMIVKITRSRSDEARRRAERESRVGRPPRAPAQPTKALDIPATFDASDDEGEITRLAPSAAPRLSGDEQDAGYEAATEAMSKPAVHFEAGSANDVEEPSAPDRVAVAAAGRSDKGIVRRRNDDAFVIDSGIGLYVVADGMGGHADGDIAARLAVDEVAAAVRSPITSAEALGVEALAHLPPRGRELVFGIERANEAVQAAARKTRAIMGATIVAARVSPKLPRITIASAGDCRAYRLRDGVLRQLTSDHTLGAAGVKGPRASRVCRAVGAAPTIAVDLFVDAPAPRDLYIFCSDGLPRMLADHDIQRLAVEHAADPADTVTTLILAANAAGGRDNVTVVVIRVGEAGA